MKPSIIIIGAGGHGKVVYDAIIAQNKFQIVGFVDSVLPIGTVVIDVLKVICNQAEIESLHGNDYYFIVAIGNNESRAKIFETYRHIFKTTTIIHPSSIIGSNVNLGAGSVVLGNAILNAFCVVGENTIVNSGVIIDHEAVIGKNAYLKIGSIVGNNAKVADYYTSDLGEIIKPFSN